MAPRPTDHQVCRENHWIQPALHPGLVRLQRQETGRKDHCRPITPWTQPVQTKYVEKPKDGDLIEIFRGPYQHWAVYVGDGFVVHLTSNSEGSGSGASSGMSVTGDKAIVKKEELRKVVGSNKWKINNSLDKQYKPRPAHVIKREACAMVGCKRPYNIVTDNCEHFANELRYGKKESRQGREAGAILKLASVVVAVVVAGCSGDLENPVALSGGKKENKNTE